VAKLLKLKRVWFNDTKVTGAGVANLKIALPKIIYYF
tara:strand:+ start:727 stop:837 length:111 start_codon:yes stop_codon:yes gene_type:complete